MCLERLSAFERLARKYSHALEFGLHYVILFLQPH
jgi:hypothetical protein